MRSKKKKKNRIILRVHERKLLPRWQTEIEQNLALLCRTRHDRGKRGRLVTHRCAGLEKRSNYLARNACSREHNFPAATNEEKEQKEREGKRIKIQRRRERERERERERRATVLEPNESKFREDNGCRNRLERPSRLQDNWRTVRPLTSLISFRKPILTPSNVRST